MGSIGLGHRLAHHALGIQWPFFFFWASIYDKTPISTKSNFKSKEIQLESISPLSMVFPAWHTGHHLSWCSDSRTHSMLKRFFSGWGKSPLHPVFWFCSVSQPLLLKLEPRISPFNKLAKAKEILSFFMMIVPCTE